MPINSGFHIQLLNQQTQRKLVPIPSDHRDLYCKLKTTLASMDLCLFRIWRAYKFKYHGTQTLRPKKPENIQN